MVDLDQGVSLNGESRYFIEWWIRVFHQMVDKGALADIS